MILTGIFFVYLIIAQQAIFDRGGLSQRCVPVLQSHFAQNGWIQAPLMPSIAEHMGIIIPVVGSPLGAAGDLRMVDLHIPGL